MKKLILSLALVGIATTLAFGQKKVVKSADRNMKKGDLEVAYEEIKSALDDPETGEDPETYLLKGIIETKMFEADSSNTMENLEVGQAAKETFMTTFEMEGSDSTGKAGKELFKEILPDMPENFQGQGIYRLKNAAFNKAIDRY
jgi:hypothetical protein